MRAIRSFLLIFSFLLSLKSFSQTVPEIGIKTGLAGSKLVFDTLGNGEQNESGTLAGFYISPFVGFAQNEGFGVFASLGFIERGGYSDTVVRNTSGMIIESYRQTYTYSYINLYLYGKAKAKIEEVPNLYPYLLLGPSLEFLQKGPGNLDFNHQKVVMKGFLGLGVDYDFKKLSALIEYQHFFNLGSNLSSRDGKIISDKTYLLCIGIKLRIFSTKKPDAKLF